MAGRSRQLSSSLQWRLLLTLSILVTMIAIVGDLLAYQTAFRETQDLQDGQLEQIAHILDPHSAILRQNVNENLNFPESATTLPKPRILAQTIDSPYLNTLMGDSNAAESLQVLSDGFHDFVTTSRHWRVYIITRDHIRLVVAQRTAYRNHIARDSALSVVWPFLLLMPVLWVITAVWIHRLFRVTQNMSNEVARRSANDLSPLDVKHSPTEIRPFINALNRLFSQLRTAIEHDQKFIAHAAHELRTPITALTLQIARFDEPNLSETEQKKLVQQIKAGISRTQQLLVQLLLLARAQHQQHSDKQLTFTAVLPLLRDLFADILPLAEEKQQILSVEIDEELLLPISSNNLYTILKNLIVNSINYTAEHGHIRITGEKSTDQKPILWVEDSGCGIADTDKLLVLEPFYRVLGNGENGSGLGLAIVNTLCQQWDIDIVMTDSNLINPLNSYGLAVGLMFRHG